MAKKCTDQGTREQIKFLTFKNIETWNYELHLRVC
nr:MAG TPA: hypothetical protein [Caudoviricetes sp.]